MQEATHARRPSLVKFLCRKEKTEAHESAWAEGVRLREEEEVSTMCPENLADVTIVTRCNKNGERGTVAVVTRIPLRSHRVAGTPMVSSCWLKRGRFAPAEFGSGVFPTELLN